MSDAGASTSGRPRSLAKFYKEKIMAAYEIKTVSVGSTAVRLVDADSQITRKVLIGTTNNIRIGYSSAVVSTGGVRVQSVDSSSGTLKINLPADEELWAYNDSTVSVPVVIHAVENGG